MPLLFIGFTAAVFGLCFGSFANVIIYRIPRNESIMSPPSRCPACSVKLSGADLLPVVSWFLLKGKCRYCGVRISLRYPAVEAVCAALFASVAVYAGRSYYTLYSAIPLCLLAFMLLSVSVIDADTQEIPDGLLIFGAIVGAIWVIAGNLLPFVYDKIFSHWSSVFGLRTDYLFITAFNAPIWYDALLGALAGAAPLFIIDRFVMLTLKKDGFGFGDVKLMAVAGLFLGWRLTLVSFFFAFMLGGLIMGFLLAIKRVEKGSYLAFGPYLSAGVLLAMWFGEGFMRLVLF